MAQRYLDMTRAGRATEEDAEVFVAAGRRLIDDVGAEAVILAGTDLGLVFNHVTADHPVIDTLDVHVDLLAHLAQDEQTL